MSEDFTGMPKPMPRPTIHTPLSPSQFTNGHAVQAAWDHEAGHMVATCTACGHEFTQAEMAGDDALPACPPEPPPTEVAEAVADWTGMSEAERLGIMVAKVVAGLEARATEAVRHLKLVTNAVQDGGGFSFAHDTSVLEAAEEFLEAVGSTETPDQTTQEPQP